MRVVHLRAVCFETRCNYPDIRACMISCIVAFIVLSALDGYVAWEVDTADLKTAYSINEVTDE